MAKSDKGLLFFYDWRKPFSMLSGDECKELLMAMLDYSESGTQPPEFQGQAEMAASFIFPHLKRYMDSVETGRIGGKKSALSKRPIEGAIKGASRVLQPQDNTNTKQNRTTQDKDDLERRFAAFWDCYPKKVDKAAARKAFEKLAPSDALLDIMIAAIKKQQQTAQWRDKNGQFIPNPSTWLNGKRWEDEQCAVGQQNAGAKKYSTGFRTDFDDF